MSMHLPESFIAQMESQLGEEASLLFQALDSSPPVSIHLHPLKKNQQYINNPPVPWHQSLGRYLEDRPIFTLDPAFHAGSYYVQEASSMFISHGFQHFFESGKRSGLKVLDLCAAPGGKSTLLASLLPSDAFFLANEVIQSRFQILNQNLDKWGLPNTSSSNHDPDDFKALEGFFDFILVDAPCSGEGLFRKDENAREEWSDDNVILCAGRQKRILQAAVPLLKAGGILAFSTCTYNDLENIENCKWLEEEFGLQHSAIPIDDSWGLVPKEKGYQFYPHRVKGEGFFCAFFKKPDGKDANGKKIKPGFKKLKSVAKGDVEILSNWIQQPEQFEFFQTEKGIIKALPKALMEDYFRIDAALQRKSFGITLGQIKGKDLVPDHNLALSTILHKDIPKVELTKEEALIFLKKEIPQKNWEGKGWHLATFKTLPLGWLKLVPGRANNYLPTHWRIRMEVK